MADVCNATAAPLDDSVRAGVNILGEWRLSFLLGLQVLEQRRRDRDLKVSLCFAGHETNYLALHVYVLPSQSDQIPKALTGTKRYNC